MKEPTIITHMGEDGYFIFCRLCGAQSALIDYDGTFYCFDHFLKKAEEEADWKREDEVSAEERASGHFEDMQLMEARGK